MTEFPTTAFEKPDGLFDTDQLELVLGSIGCGNTGGRVWLDAEGTLGLLWDQGNNVFYLDALESADNREAELQRIVTDVIYPSALASGLKYFNVHTLSDKLTPIGEAVFARWVKGSRTKHFYTSAPDSVVEADSNVSTITYHAIDRSFLATPGRKGLNHILTEIDWMWSSIDAYNQHGFGVAATIHNDVACWCTAEYVSRDRCGIGIETAEPYRGRGIATATAGRFIGMCFDRNLHPYWECDTGNKASARIAEKLGFTDPVTTKCLTGWFA